FDPDAIDMGREAVGEPDVADKCSAVECGDAAVAAPVHLADHRLVQVELRVAAPDYELLLADRTHFDAQRWRTSRRLPQRAGEHTQHVQVAMPGSLVHQRSTDPLKIHPGSLTLGPLAFPSLPCADWPMVASLQRNGYVRNAGGDGCPVFV